MVIIGTPHLQSSSHQNAPSHLSRSITVAGDRSPSIDRTFQYTMEGDIDRSTTDKDTEPKLRTFRGWKRDTAHLDKSRLAKGLMRPHVNILLNKKSLLINLIYYFHRCQVNQL
jgi:hypothetical protein